MISGPGDADLFAFLEGAAARVLAMDRRSLVELIAQNVRIKAAVVSGDEREEAPDEAGGRALLNLGHTFAHAIETIPGAHAPGLPAPLKHGEAVAIGLSAASDLARRLGTLADEDHARVLALLRALGLPERAEGLLSTPDLIARMRDDKKVRGDRLRFVVPQGLGGARVRSDVPAELVGEALESVRAV